MSRLHTRGYLNRMAAAEDKEFSDQDLHTIKHLLLQVAQTVNATGRLASDIEGEIYNKLKQRLHDMGSGYELGVLLGGRQKHLSARLSNKQRSQLVELIRSIDPYSIARKATQGDQADEITQMKASSGAAARAAEDANKAVANVDSLIEQLAELDKFIEGDTNE